MLHNFIRLWTARLCTPSLNNVLRSNLPVTQSSNFEVFDKWKDARNSMTLYFCIHIDQHIIQLYITLN